MRVHVAPAIVLLAASVACSPGSPATGADGTWVGTITTEGDVTTVVNESGSMWGGNAELVEEASIGVELGAEEYMFGNYYDIAGLAATGDTLYLIDQSVPIVRRYTFDGQFLGDIGGEGDGPGEYRFPNAIAVSGDGRVFVRARNRRRIAVYSSEGDYLDEHPMPLIRNEISLAVTDAGVPYGPQLADEKWANGESVFHMLAHGPDGPFGPPRVPPRYDVDPPFIYGPEGGRVRIRHAPDYVWRMTAAGEMIGGASNSYRFSRTTAASVTTRIERIVEPVPISEREQDATRRRLDAFVERQWGNARAWPNPRTKPAFVRFIPTESGELWVLRLGVSEPRPDCESNPEDQYSSHCWYDTFILDAFDQEGRYLGEITIPQGTTPAMLTFAQGYMDRLAIVRGDLVILRAVDQLDTVMVKRYRLVLPER